MTVEYEIIRKRKQSSAAKWVSRACQRHIDYL